MSLLLEKYGINEDETEGHDDESMEDEAHAQQRRLPFNIDDLSDDDAEFVNFKLSTLQEKVADSLGTIGRNERYIPVDHVYLVENYRLEKFTQDPNLDLHGLEFLDQVLGSASEFLQAQLAPKRRCIIS